MKRRSFLGGLLGGLAAAAAAPALALPKMPSPPDPRTKVTIHDLRVNGQATTIRGGKINAGSIYVNHLHIGDRGAKLPPFPLH